MFADRDLDLGSSPKAPHGSDMTEGVEVTGRCWRWSSHATSRRRPGETWKTPNKQHFYELNCIGCHKPKQVTSRDSVEPEHAFQLIWPYSDFLLHDMGEGLADGRPEGRASAREWRTAPLWGIGLTTP